MPSNVKVAFFTLRDAYFEDGKCYFDYSNGRLVEQLAMHYPLLSFVTYQVHQKNPGYNYEVKVNAIYKLPFSNTFLNGLINFVQVFRMLKRIQREHDVIIIQYPFKTFFVPLFLSKPVICHICSNLLTASKNPVKYSGFNRFFAIQYSRIFHLFNKLMFRKKNVKVVANGMELSRLYHQYGTTNVVSSSIRMKEIIDPAQVKKRNSVFTILFVGRPSLEKGFDTLMQAVNMLQATNSDVRLMCVGFTESEFDTLYAGPINSSFIEFKGNIPFSEKLFEIYRSADVLILPSRSEGTPRVLVEARSFGCPVIATKVGGIPDSISDGKDGLLFDAGDSDQLAKSIERLYSDEEYRIQLAINGIECVKNMTLEKFSDTFVRIIEKEIIRNG